MLKRISAVLSKSSTNLSKPVPAMKVSEKEPSVTPRTPEDQTELNSDGSDCASVISNLDGYVELRVKLPNGKTVLMTVERRMPMLDLLIYVANTHKIIPGNHQINVMNKERNELISYKASTPIGTINSTSVEIVRKNLQQELYTVKQSQKANVQPFEKTFRLQVHLPHNQLMVIRVKPEERLSDVFNTVCQRNDLDPGNYFLQHPKSPELDLDMSNTLAFYNLTEINIVATRIPNIPLKSPKEKKSPDSNQTPGYKKIKLFGLPCRKKRSSMGDSSSDENSSRGVSPSRSNSDKTSNSVSPPPPMVSDNLVTRPVKKRAAPVPPDAKPRRARERPPAPPPLHPKAPLSKNKEEEKQLHSRQSSDSSGYHESSVIEDSPENRGVKKMNANKSDTILSSSSGSSSIQGMKGVKKRRAPQPPAPKILTGMPEEVNLAETRTNEKTNIDESSVDTESFSPPSNSTSMSSATKLNCSLPITKVNQVIECINTTSLDKLEDDKVLNESEVTEPSTADSNSISKSSDEKNAPTLPISTMLDEDPKIQQTFAEEEKMDSEFGDTPSIEATELNEEISDVSNDKSDSLNGRSPEISRNADVWDVSRKDLEKSNELDVNVECDWDSVEVSDGEELSKDKAGKEVVVSMPPQGEISAVSNVFENDTITIKDELEGNKNYNWNIDQARQIASEEEWVAEDNSEVVVPTVPSVHNEVIDYSEHLVNNNIEILDNMLATYSTDADNGHISSEAESEKTSSLEKEEQRIAKQMSTALGRWKQPLQNFSIDTYSSNRKIPKTLSHSESLNVKSIPEEEDEKENRYQTVRSNSFQDKQSSAIKFRIAVYDSLERLNQTKPSSNKEPEENYSTNDKSKWKSMSNLSGNENHELKRTFSDQGINADGELTMSEKEDYRRLQSEYTKLERQLANWQRQLQYNQTLLQTQCNIPQNLPELPSEIFTFNVNSLPKQSSTQTGNNTQEESSAYASSESLRNGQFSPDPSFKSSSHYKPIVKVQSMKERIAINDDVVSNNSSSSNHAAVNQCNSVRNMANIFSSDKADVTTTNTQEPKLVSSNKNLEKLTRIDKSGYNHDKVKLQQEKVSVSKFQRQRKDAKLIAEDQVRLECNGNVARGKLEERNEKFKAGENTKLREVMKVAEPMPTKIPQINSRIEKVELRKTNSKHTEARKTFPVSSHKGKSGSNAHIDAQVDNRGLLLNAIREFGGRSNLRKVPKSETTWHTWHGPTS